MALKRAIEVPFARIDVIAAPSRSAPSRRLTTDLSFVKTSSANIGRQIADVQRVHGEFLFTSQV